MIEVRIIFTWYKLKNLCATIQNMDSVMTFYIKCFLQIIKLGDTLFHKWLALTSKDCLIHDS